jgi:hypothetical protein
MSEVVTAMAADVLTRVQAEIDARLRGLRPVVAEYEQLLDAAAALDAEARERPAPKTETAVLARPGRKPKAAVKPKPAAKSKPVAEPQPPAKPKPRRAARAKSAATPTGPAEQAIVAALEHGSHTVGELGVVTGMSGSEIRDGARCLLAVGKIVRAKREGRAAYALSGAA